MKFCLPREWSYDGHVHLSSQNLLLENNLSILSLAYHLISSLMGHLLCIRSFFFFFFFFFFFYICMRVYIGVSGIKVWVMAKISISLGGGYIILEYIRGWVNESLCDS